MFNMRMDVESGKKSKRTLRSEIQSTRAIVYTLEPARLHAINAALAMDKIVPAHVDRTIVVAKCNSATSSEKEDTNKKEK
jgi:signal transduction histidine kinase